MDKPLTLLIKRTSGWQEFHVMVPEPAYVLDALEAAWRQDSSLMFRHSCHHASCGSCGMRIQGRERLSCITPAFDVARGGILRLEPLRNFTVVTDLVVDINPLAHKLERVKAHVITERSFATLCKLYRMWTVYQRLPGVRHQQRISGSGCTCSSGRNMDDLEVRSQVEGQNGVWRCHSAFECTEVCPAGVEPAAAIMNLRKEMLVSVFRRKGK